MSEHDDQMRALFHSIADEAQLPVGSDIRLLRAARRRRKLTAGIATLSLVLAIGAIAGASALWSPTDPRLGTEIGGRGEDGSSAHYDETSGECIGDPGPALDECNAELGRVRSSLKNAATAQESFATTTADGRYTNRFSDLAGEGFEKPDDIAMKIFGPSVSDAFYCMEAYSDELGGIVHYSSEVGSPQPGQCFPELESVLKNAATSEESYATVNDGRYTEDIQELKSEGLVLPDDVELTITVARRRYCIEALSKERDATLHFSSTSGVPKPGPCEGADP